MKIVTGYRGEPHITSAQDRAIHQGIFGTGSYIMAIGQQMAAEIISANEIRIKDGALSHQGCVAVIEQGTFDTLDIANGSQGMQRIDLVVARYSVEPETEEENMELIVIEGTPASSDPAVPDYNSGDIQAGDSPVDMPLFRVNIDGIAIDSVTRVGSIIHTRTGLADSFIKKTGDTFSGPYYHQTGRGRFCVQDMTVEKGVVPSSRTVNGGFYIVDKNRSEIGMIRTSFFTDGREGIQLAAYRTISGTFIGNEVNLTLDANGKRHVNVTEPGAWRAGIGAIASDNVKFVKKSVANISCAANDAVTVTFPSPLETGWTVLGMVDLWADGTGTTSPTAPSYMLPVNHWSENTAEPKGVYRNIANTAAKFTANVAFLLVRNT